MQIKPKGELIFCSSGNAGVKLHVARNIRGPAFGPICKARGRNRGSVIAHPGIKAADIDRVCSRCAQYCANEEA